MKSIEKCSSPAAKSLTDHRRTLASSSPLHPPSLFAIMEPQESSAADYRLGALCGSDLNLEATRAVLRSLSPETKLRELRAEVSCWMEHMP